MSALDNAPGSHHADFTAFKRNVAEHRELFAPELELVLARAPGRLDVMGGIADYSGSFVLELPLAVGTFVAVQLSHEPLIRLRSSDASAFGGESNVSIPLENLAPNGAPIEYAAAREALTGHPGQRWAAYVVGALVVLARELSLTITRGVNILVESSVPAGKGVASSAALEVAAMAALYVAYRALISPRTPPLTLSDIAILSQKVENLVVGAPCGIMDQMTAARGERDHLLALLCQPAKFGGSVSLPPSIELWGIDSGIRHEVGGSDYTRVRVGAFMGYRIVADLAGLQVTRRVDHYVEIDDPRWGGYLANITPEEWDSSYRSTVPEKMLGADFLERYGGTTDRVTRVEPHLEYAIRMPTEHPIRENRRVRAFGKLLAEGARTEDERIALGQLMYQSHASYSACGLGSSGTDRLVELVRESAPAEGLYGAKITGGGSGGVVAVLARTGARRAVHAVADRYAQETGRPRLVLHGSSDGVVVETSRLG